MSNVVEKCYQPFLDNFSIFFAQLYTLWRLWWKLLSLVYDVFNEHLSEMHFENTHENP